MQEEFDTFAEQIALSVLERDKHINRIVMVIAIFLFLTIVMVCTLYLTSFLNNIHTPAVKIETTKPKLSDMCSKLNDSGYLCIKNSDLKMIKFKQTDTKSWKYYTAHTGNKLRYITIAY